MWEWFKKQDQEQQVITSQPTAVLKKSDIEIAPKTHIDMKNSCNCNDCFAVIFNCQKNTQNYERSRVTNLSASGSKNKKMLLNSGIPSSIEVDPKTHIDLSNSCNCSNCFSCVFNCQKDMPNPNDFDDQRQLLLAENQSEEEGHAITS